MLCYLPRAERAFTHTLGIKLKLILSPGMGIVCRENTTIIHSGLFKHSLNALLALKRQYSNTVCGVFVCDCV